MKYNERKQLVFFPTLENDGIKKIWDASKKDRLVYGTPELFYTLDGNNYPLTLIPLENNEYNVKDNNGAFDPLIHNLHLKGTITLQNINVLFGSQGLVPNDSELGVAIQWFSTYNAIRGTSDCKIIKNDNDIVSYSYDCQFDPGTLSRVLEFQFIMYVKSCGNILDDEKHLAHLPGTCLGTLFRETLYLKGNLSSFPIIECSFKENLAFAAHKNTLWQVVYNSDDPVNDFFDKEHICIYMNSSHPNYSSLSKTYEDPFYREIISTAISIIIIDTIETMEKNAVDWLALKDDECERGSVGSAVLRMVDCLCKMDRGSCKNFAQLHACLADRLYTRTQELKRR